MYNYVTQEFICPKDDNIGNSVICYEKGVLMPSI